MSFDVRTRLNRLKHSAKARGIRVNLDVNKYQNLIDCGCHYCGSDLSKENGYCLDRVDNNKGYTVLNVVPCCKICNRAKSGMDIWEFVTWLMKAGEFTKKQIKIVQDGIKKGDIYSLEEELVVHNKLNESKEKLRIFVK